MAQYVCNGAMLKCSFGLAPSTLIVLPDKMITESEQPAANIMDNKPMVNIMPFGMCQSIANPTVASATSAAMGVLTPMPCIPSTTAPWMPGKPQVLIKNLPALNNTCKLMCMWGGVIQVVSPGQVISSDGAGGSGASGTDVDSIATQSPDKPKPCTRESVELHKAIDKAFPPGSAENLQAHELVNKYVGHPVNVANGNFFTKQEDFSVPGIIPLVWERRYFSNSHYDGPMGYGWHHLYDWSLQVSDREKLAVIRMGDGRNAMFDHIPLSSHEEWRFHRSEKLYLGRHADGHFFIRDRDNKTYDFSIAPLRKKEHLLTSISNPDGYAIRFQYDHSGNLIGIIDTAGRKFTLEINRKGRIIAIHSPHPTEEGKWYRIAGYEYDSDGNLISQSNAISQSIRFEYRKHLIVKETWRNGLNWYFVYDGKTTGSKCIETWGDGDLLHNHLTYEPGVTHTVNSLGQKTSFYHQNGIVYKTVDARGAEWFSCYTEFDEVSWESDPLGNITAFEYDDQGNTIQTTDATGGGTLSRYLPPPFFNLPVELITANGAKWQWEYNQGGELVHRIDPLGSVTSYTYRDGLLSEIVDGKENKTVLSYDRYNNLTDLKTPDGYITQFNYDRLGRLTSIKDAKGNSRVFTLDLLGRPVTIGEPDGNIRTFAYDPEDNIIGARDKNRDIQLRYNGLGKLVSRNENNTSIRLQYNTENFLSAVYNEHGSRYSFILNEVGDIIQETGFDGITRKYERDLAGQVTRLIRPGGKTTGYQYDGAGRITSIVYDDGAVVEYKYQPGGELAEAINSSGSVKIERDLLGRVIKENFGENWVESIYDGLGNRTLILSSLGASIQHDYNNMGDPMKLLTEQWNAIFERDEFGLEKGRRLQGNISSSWERDSLGRPMSHKISNSVGQVSRHRSYRWDFNDRLKEIRDSLSGTRLFAHDTPGNLVSTIYGNGIEELRLPDAIGNLFRKSDKSDRRYGLAGQLLEADGTFFSYDLEGNLVEKKESNGKVWRYRWNEEGMLESVIRPDEVKVSFTYDALGRRLSKNYHNTVTKWLWDGNTPLHEWKEDLRSGEILGDSSIDKDGVITWVFEADSFVPAAKLKKEKAYSIITDHIGTPFSMYDEHGSRAWEAEYDSFGKITRYSGDSKTHCPFRYQGQYEDVETGLYYNRFRYYDPEEAVYISQDPIGLAGNNPTFYAYVHDPNSWVDRLGLSGGCGADKTSTNAAMLSTNGVKLNEHLYQLEKYGTGGYKSLQNGRIRYFGEATLNRGNANSFRMVREWNPATGGKRTWFETLNPNGGILQVRPELGSGVKTHYLFDGSGGFLGTW